MSTALDDTGGGGGKAWLRALERVSLAMRDPSGTLPLLIDRLAEQHGDASALLTEGQTVTFASLAERVQRYACWALRHNVRPGEVVALVMSNSCDYPALWLGITRVGGVAALVNCNLAAAGLAHSLQIARPRHVVVSVEFEESVAAVMPTLSPGTTGWSHGAPARHFPRIDLDIAQDAAVSPGMGDRGAPTLSDRALLIFTSGTTGYPKAAHVSHGRVVQWSQWFAGLMGVTPADRMYNCLPMYHSIGGVVATCAPLLGGGSVVIRQQFSASRFWDEISYWDCTIFQYIGELCRYLVRSGPHAKETGHRLRLCCGNGLRADVWQVFENRFAIPQILEYYAATEATFSLYNVEGKCGAIGRIPGFLTQRLAVRLIRVDIETGTPLRDAEGFCMRCSRGEAGEAISRIGAAGARAGGQFEGYTDSEASERKILHDVFAPGDAWYRSGDLMRQDDEGFFYFVDRLGETFRWKGENVSTAEVAAVVEACPGIASAAVYGVQVGGTEGRAGMAALVIGAEFDPAVLRAHLVASLPDYARPCFLRIRREIEMTSTFRPKLRDLAQEGFDPHLVGDALYVDDRSAGAFIVLDAAVHAEILAERMRL
jgi:fatty-acyl-CoA synthase